MNRNKMWWENYSGSFSGICVSCSAQDVYMSDRIVTEMIQKNLIKPEDLARVNESGFPKDKRNLLLSLLKG